MMPTVGWLSSVLGYRRLYISVLLDYTLFAFLGAMAWSIEALIAFRILQGLAEGPVPSEPSVPSVPRGGREPARAM
jgi:MFS family permease